mmetsp:Transcript_26408/g.70581  ORF Transcript_26408/g.70581 Transcript_26408/m.70581 type:complete len:200 (-) Transcript_26408:492-1091(-)
MWLIPIGRRAELAPRARRSMIVLSNAAVARSRKAASLSPSTALDETCSTKARMKTWVTVVLTFNTSFIIRPRSARLVTSERSRAAELTFAAPLSHGASQTGTSDPPPHSQPRASGMPPMRPMRLGIMPIMELPIIAKSARKLLAIMIKPTSVNSTPKPMRGSIGANTVTSFEISFRAPVTFCVRSLKGEYTAKNTTSMK